jgi:two-component system, chemotaxis family, chemotaxis protein CheY
MPRKVMIVDDSGTARMFVRRCLEITRKFEDAEFFEAANGVEALALLQNKEQTFTIVFTDLNMPEMDGEQLFKSVRANPRLTELPVVVISSAGNPAKEQQLREWGVAALVKKPVSPARLNAVLSELEQAGVLGQADAGGKESE